MPAEVRHGATALCELAAQDDVDTVMAAIVGAAGLGPCLAAARAGKRLLLANKEALVVGGDLFMRAVKAGGATLLPIDSEHSAIFQCLPDDRSRWHERIDHIVLTASGGPFRGRSPATLGRGHARPGLRPSELGDGPQDLGRFGDDDEQGARGDRGALPVRPSARADPGRDPSAEHHPFDGGLPRPVGAGPARHRRHAGADRLRPGLARADRLRHRGRSTGARSPRSPSKRPITRLYPALGLAYDALRGPPGTSAVLNAANEEAVAAFLSGTIRFDRIHKVNAGRWRP